ncbi:Pkinase-domain-containing protein [Polychaeton citri CBS 116435]|uniref:non-specific serine/threonine protein kinase n=1 Tax=Polychaeton citri CBS 116435 TaxID=1314669 RepID=A0A9P4UI70_9PEZI|nr:Pkinase-domain-containing protein [Polychaeton citri CBS 116435]
MATADDYQVLEELGSGSFGIVYKAIEKATGDLVAIKHIDLEGSDDDIREIQQEISLLATCSSDYVTRYKASFVRNTKLWIVMEFLGGGSCLDLLRPGPMEEMYIAIILRELLMALSYLHETGKIHRDIKAANVLLSDNGRVKIADFGVAAQLTNIKSQRLTFVGTPFWMAPEVIQEHGYDYKADIWSLGITAMEMALGEPPRSDIHPMKVLFLIPKEKPPRLEGNKWSKELKDFVARCLNKEAEQRPSAKALLKHPFIRKAGPTDRLRELISKVRHFESRGHESDRDLRYYEETLRPMNGVHMDDEDEDEWVFDTIRPHATMKKHTIKRRRLERIPSGDAANGELDDATLALREMSLENAPLGGISNSPGLQTPSRMPSTIRTPKTRQSSGQRKISAQMARKISGHVVGSPSPVTRKMSRQISGQTPTAVRRASRQMSGATPTARRISSQQPQPKQPLGVDMSFGNGTSTVRQFKRVSSGQPAKKLLAAGDDSIDENPHDSDAENHPPPTRDQPPAQPAVAATKEAILGRRSYAKCVDPAFQEVSTNTADSKKQAAISKVAEAWSELDQIDPEGELLLLKAILDRIQADPKLTGALLPQRAASTQLQSLRTASPTKKGSIRVATAEIAGSSPQPLTPSKNRRGSELPLAGSPSPTKSPTKLVLNPQNPHLKMMRSSQALQEAQVQQKAVAQKPTKEKDLLDEKMPGKQPEPGMEHVSLLADVLYGRWTEGLKARWPMS